LQVVDFLFKFIMLESLKL